MFIWAGDKPENKDRKKLHDGGYAIRKFGEWVSEDNQDIKINVSYYPELKDEEVKEPYRFMNERKKLSELN